jgi:phosphohistidine phosphatase
VEENVTRRLVLIRHAKAEAGGDSDRGRILAPRGQADAAALGRWLADQGLRADRVVVSPARRARQTWELAAAATDWPDATVEDGIYDNTVDSLVQVIRATPAEVETLALVGHNPSLAVLARMLDDGTPGEFPTSGVAVFTVSGGWATLDTAATTLIHFGVPRG